jgi:myo-inositol 2-dehydrogenase / D-chiro-inositol 1-dehydrogenase
MKVALVGSGRMGSFHRRTLTDHPAVREVAVYDVDPGRRTLPTLDEALASADAAVIVTPAATHGPLIERCLGARIPTFCEKPLALGLGETERLAALASETAAPLQVGFQRRFDAGYVEARRRIAEGELGRIFSFVMHARDRVPPPREYIPTSGGLFRDAHVHDLDAARWLLGQEVSEVFADGAVRAFEMFAELDDVDTSAVVIRMADGTLGALIGGRSSPVAGYDIRAEVFGSGGAVAIGPAEPRVYADFLDRFADAYRAEMDHFLRLARGEAPNPCTAFDALHALRAADACDRSRRERRPIRVEGNS